MSALRLKLKAIVGLRDLRQIALAGNDLLELVNTSLDSSTFSADYPTVQQLGHAFRTPLNAILGYAELLQEAPRSRAREERESMRSLPVPGLRNEKFQYAKRLNKFLGKETHQPFTPAQRLSKPPRLLFS